MHSYYTVGIHAEESTIIEAVPGLNVTAIKQPKILCTLFRQVEVLQFLSFYNVSP